MIYVYTNFSQLLNLNKFLATLRLEIYEYLVMCNAVIHHHGREARGVDRIRRMCEVMWTGADVVWSLHRSFVGFTLPGDAVLPGVPQ